MLFHDVAGNIRKAVAERFEKDLNVTISIGVATRQAGMGQPADPVKADVALYAAKEEGKNRVMLFERKHQKR